jgi:hypothetical protein
MMPTHKVKNNSQLKRRKDQQIESFYAELDCRKYDEFILEESFHDLLATIQNKAKAITTSLKVAGKDHVDFKILFPFPQFCACLSQCYFDRVRDVTFR